jgi:hypothetical protein
MGHSNPRSEQWEILGIDLCSDLGWADQVSYTVKMVWKALHFTLHILTKGNSNTESLAYTSLVHPILEYGAACWDPYMEGLINVLDQLQNKVAKFAHHRNDSNWKTLAQGSKISRIRALFKTYMGEWALKDISDRLQRLWCLEQSRS